MTDYTTNPTSLNNHPYFPDNPQDYAPWVSEHGLNAPYGECQCGCGKKTNIAFRNQYEKGIAKDEPCRFIVGHANRINDFQKIHNPSGLCMCGCGQPAPIAKTSSSRYGHVKGEPVQFINGHNGRKHFQHPPPNPGNLCMCGCGNPVPLATITDISRGHIAGKPVRFLPSHNKRRGTIEKRFWEKVDKRGPDECWDWKAANHKGYGKIGIGTRENGDRHVAAAHRLSYELHYGPIPDGMCVCHKCDRPQCVNPNHLWLGTLADNTHDMYEKGRENNTKSLRGEKHVWAKFTDNQIREIRQRHDQGETQTSIAKDHSVRQCTISSIVLKKTWKHID